MHRIGLISDTHGLLRPEAVAQLQGCDAIVHGGDIGTPEILQAFAAIAPLTVVRGNNDRGDWAESIPMDATLQMGDALLYAVHDIADMRKDLKALGVRAVVSGHSHKPSVQVRDGVLFVNPGSAGPRRFKLPVTVARLTVRGAEVSAALIPLDEGTAAKPPSNKAAPRPPNSKGSR